MGRDLTFDLISEAGYAKVDTLMEQLVLDAAQLKPRRNRPGAKILQDVREELGATIDEEGAPRPRHAESDLIRTG